MTSTPLTDARRRELLAPPPPGAVLDVVIDTDPTNEVDDQFAMVWALLHPERLNVVGLHACPYGFSPALLQGGALLSELDAAGLDRRLAQLGITAADVPTLTPADGVDAAEAELHRIAALLAPDVPVLGGSRTYLADPGTPVVSPAAEHLVELAHADREGPLYVVGIGCATNLASALLLDPTIADRVVFTWTSAYPTFWPGVNTSFNLAQDVHAARVLLDAGAAVHYLPGYHVGEKLRTSLPELQSALSGGGRVAQYLLDTYTGHPLIDSARGRSKVVWDLVNVAWLLDPSWLVTRFVPTPHLDDDLRWRADDTRHVLLESIDVDRDAVFGDLFDRVAEAG